MKKGHRRRRRAEEDAQMGLLISYLHSITLGDEARAVVTMDTEDDPVSSSAHELQFYFL